MISERLLRSPTGDTVEFLTCGLTFKRRVRVIKVAVVQCARKQKYQPPIALDIKRFTNDKSN